jgi:hypothetical protein
MSGAASQYAFMALCSVKNKQRDFTFTFTFTFTLLTEEHRLRMFQNRVLRRIFRLKKEEVAGGWRRLYKMRNFIICTLHSLLGRSSQGG